MCHVLATFICPDVGYHHWWYGVRVGSYESRCQVDIVGLTPWGECHLASAGASLHSVIAVTRVTQRIGLLSICRKLHASADLPPEVHLQSRNDLDVVGISIIPRFRTWFGMMSRTPLGYYPPPSPPQLVIPEAFSLHPSRACPSSEC